MKKIVEFLIEVEGLKLKAYQCSAGRWTIGIGNTFYEDGTPVKPGDRISYDRALTLGEVVALGFVTHVKKRVKVQLTENQLIALVSFCYNVGTGAFDKSQLLKRVNADPNDPSIKNLFPVSFVTAAGIPSPGIVNRRRKEANKYFTA